MKRRSIIFAIIVLLLGLGVALCPKRELSPEQKTRKNIASIRAMIWAYFKSEGRFPNQKRWCRDLLFDESDDEALLEDGEIRRVLDAFFDGWGRPLRYRVPGRHNKQAFDLYSVGPDGHDDNGMGDDIGSWMFFQELDPKAMATNKRSQRAGE